MDRSKGKGILVISDQILNEPIDNPKTNESVQTKLAETAFA